MDTKLSAFVCMLQILTSAKQDRHPVPMAAETLKAPLFAPVTSPTSWARTAGSATVSPLPCTHTHFSGETVKKIIYIYRAFVKYSDPFTFLNSFFPLINPHSIPHINKAKHFLKNKKLKYHIDISIQTLAMTI